MQAGWTCRWSLALKLPGAKGCLLVYRKPQGCLKEQIRIEFVLLVLPVFQAAPCAGCEEGIWEGDGELSGWLLC